MMLRPIRNALLALAVAPLAAAPAAAAETYEAAFDFRIAGIRAGEISMGGVESGRTYEARAKVNTAGLVGIFADFRFDGTAAGGVAGDGRIVPQVFRASSVSPRAARETRIDWENGTPVFVSVKPERSTSPDPSNQTGTLDPVSASFALLRDVPVAEVCGKSVDVFDGSRRSRITLGKPEMQGDGEILCNGRYERLEGEEQTFNTSSSYPFKAIFRDRGDGVAQLQRLDTKTQFGRAALVRK